MPRSPPPAAPSTDKYRLRGLKLLEAGAFAAAIDQFRRNLRAAPGSLDDRLLLAQALARSGQPGVAEAELRAVLACAPDLADAHAGLGQLLARTGRRVQAVAHFERALTLAPGHWAASELTALRSQIGSSVHSWHLPMLADAARNAAFQAAIEAAVRPDDLVLDIGTGTGLLAMMAARAGAEHVVACEMLPDLAELARLVVAENGYTQQVSVVNKRSSELVVGVDLPRRATVLVSEIFDALVIGEGALDTFRHAWEHLLAEDARIIPAGAVIRAHLAEMPRLSAMHPLRSLNGFDLSAVARHALEKQFYPVHLEGEVWTKLSEPVDIIRFDFRRPIPSRREWAIPVPVTRTGVLQALVLWLELELDGRVTISSGPGGDARHWNPVVFLFDAEPAVTVGRAITVEARMGNSVLFFSVQ